MDKGERLRRLQTYRDLLERQDKVLEKSKAVAVNTAVVSSLIGEYQRIEADFPDLIPGLVEDLRGVSFTTVDIRLQIARALASINSAIDEIARSGQRLITGRSVFIGHGRSLVWMQLKQFLSERLHLHCDEFNKESTAGIATVNRLKQMLDDAAFAFLIMTGEDVYGDDTVHARENVIHEVGLFQGHLGFERAIILLEDGCTEFSNIHGLTQIRFPKGDIGAKFEEIRMVLEREGLIAADQRDAGSPKKPIIRLTARPGPPLPTRTLPGPNPDPTRAALDALNARLRELAESHSAIWVEPMVPARENRVFYVRQASGEKTVVESSNGLTVEIPTTRMEELLPATSSARPQLFVSGRVQWLTQAELWRFFPERPEGPNAELGVFRTSSPVDPRAKEVANTLQARGLRCGWINEPDLAQRRAEGWEIVYDDDGRYFRSRDSPHDQILITRQS